MRNMIQKRAQPVVFTLDTRTRYGFSYDPRAVPRPFPRCAAPSAEEMSGGMKRKAEAISQSDGEEQDDPSEAQLELFKKLNTGYRTKINVIQIGFEPRPGCTLERLAKENRGQYKFLNIADLPPVPDALKN